MEHVRLGDVCARKIDMLQSNYCGKISYVDISSVDNETKRITSVQHLDASEAPSRARQLIRQNDILVSIVRPNLNAVAKVSITYNDLLVASTGYCVLRCLPDIDERYVFYFCQSPSFVSCLTSQATGASYPAVNGSIIRNCLIPLPEIEEQHRIADKFQLIYTIIYKRRQQLEKLDTLVKSQFIEMFGDVNINSKGYPSLLGKDLFSFSSGKFLCEEKRKETGYPVYGGNGIAWHTDEILIDYPTLVIGRVGAYCGNVKLAKEPKWITDNAIYIKKFKKNCFTLDFLYRMMVIMNLSQYAAASGQPKITQKPLEDLQYIVPPIDLQKRFTDIAEQADKSKFAIQQSLDKLETLKKALMQKYFG